MSEDPEATWGRDKKRCLGNWVAGVMLGCVKISVLYSVGGNPHGNRDLGIYSFRLNLPLSKIPEIACVNPTKLTQTSKNEKGHGKPVDFRRI
jgi:hypothetical protein